MKKLLLGLMLLLFGMYALPSSAKTGHFVLNFDCSNLDSWKVSRVFNYKKKEAYMGGMTYGFTCDAPVYLGGHYEGVQFGNSSTQFNYNKLFFNLPFAGVSEITVQMKGYLKDKTGQLNYFYGGHFFVGYTTDKGEKLVRFYLAQHKDTVFQLGERGDSIKGIDNDLYTFKCKDEAVNGNVFFKMHSSLMGYFLRLQKIDVTCDVVDIPTYRYAASTSTSAIDYPASGLTPFSVSIKDGKAVLTPVSGIVAANSPVLVFGKKDTDMKAYTYPLVASLTDAGTAVTSDMKVSDGTIKGDGSTIFELGENSSNEVGFKRVDNGTTVADGTGYVKVTDATSDFIPLTNSISMDVSSVGYATYYDSEHQLAVPAGATAYTYKVSNNTLIKSKTYTTGSIIPKATGVVIESDQGTVLFPYADDATAETDADNMLRGSDTETITTGGGKYYMLSLNSSSEVGSVGFYYGTDEGAAFTTGAHKAYLVVPSTVAASAKGWAFKDQSNQTPTSIALPKTTVYDGATYNLAGQRVDSSYRGIVIRNGKKYINR